MKIVLPWTRAYRARKVARETDFGRRYGWFVEREGQRIGELTYVRWDSDGQFWHDYSVTWCNEEESRVESDPDAWIEKKLVLRSKHYLDVVVSVFLTAPRGKNRIVVRFASVPVERFEKDETI